MVIIQPLYPISVIEALDILENFQNRFQIEFLYRDGKQHTGLNDCQARSENKLHVHFIASLTANQYCQSHTLVEHS